MRTDHSDDSDLRNIALLACLIVAEYENELIEFPAGESMPVDRPGAAMGLRSEAAALVDFDAAATVWLLAQAGVALSDVGPYLRAERSIS